MGLKERAQERLIREEGLELEPYVCPAGYWTWGAGRNIQTRGLALDETLMVLRKGPTREVAIYVLNNDIDEAVADLSRMLPNWNRISEARQVALVDMRHQLGPAGIRAFQLMLSAIINENWAVAAAELLDSKYARQTPQRAARNAVAIREG